MRISVTGPVAFALLIASFVVSELTSAATDDQNLTGLVYLSDGTPLSSTPWADGTGFAVWVNHGGSWSTAWRYPAAGWYLTSGGAYSIVLPANEKDVSWANADPYRVEFDVSAITGNPEARDNATSHGTGDPGEFPPLGASSNAIVWNATDNWQRWDVVLLAPADLAILPGDSTATPSTVQVGQSVQLEVKVRNAGNRAASSSVAVFFDEDSDQFPDPSEILDQPPFSLDAGMNATFSYMWSPVADGTYAFCGYADPLNALLETDEGNNVDCTYVLVQPAPETRPDYAINGPLPASPARAGLSRPVSLSVQIRNEGNATGRMATGLAFFNASTPGSPFATLSVPSLSPSGTSARFTATWTSPATPGTYAVTGEADHGDALVEWNEANNAFTWTIRVVSGPVTGLVLGAPNVTAARTSVTSATDLSFSVLDQGGAGIDATSYRIDNGTWTNFTAGGPFRLTGEGAHFLEWYSEDLAGNVEAVQSAILVVDDTPPTSTPAVGAPKYLTGGTFVTSATPISLAATDVGIHAVGVGALDYRIDAGAWLPFTVPFNVPGAGAHALAFRAADLLGNAESINTLPVTVDDTAPTLSLAIGTPQYGGVELFVKSSTPLMVSASDGGPVPVGVASIEYRIDGGSWTPFATPFTVPAPDGTRSVEYAAADHLGHRASDSRDLVVDDTPPVTTLAPAAGPFGEDTVFTLTASDAGSGVARTDVRFDEQSWTRYSVAFALSLGDHVVRYQSVDRLGNVESERTFLVTVEAAPPTPETNWKLLVAAAFSALLLVVGWWAAVRGGYRSKDRRVRDLAKTFLPFPIIEASTGIISFSTGLLSIPPVLGLGTAVDLTILVAGLAVAVRRYRQRPSPRT